MDRSSKPRLDGHGTIIEEGHLITNTITKVKRGRKKPSRKGVTETRIGVLNETSYPVNV